MDQLLFLIPGLPLAGFLILALAGRRLNKAAIAITGAGSVTLSALITLIIGFSFLGAEPEGGQFRQSLWKWMTTANLDISFSLRMDALTLVFVFIITFVGALIHIYSTGFMRHDRDYARFFASMNLFVCAMLLLVLGDNLVLLYLGWEGVGLCSYLLIGFWYESPANCDAARKAFVITRIGDTAMAVGLFLLFRELGTLNIDTILAEAPARFASGDPLVTCIALLLLGGGMGKSAQLPLQTWLPDAMAGPSPVSALIHAATMVTAGVYLIARMHGIFLLSPFAMDATALVGGLTLFIAGCSAMAQTDIKRILAYSTISQIGYMFLALGIGAWSAGIFHFFTHAFFKALLFLAAGTIIECLHHEHSIFKMGGLKDKMPVVFWTFLAGTAALAALPFVSSGFFSKDMILWYSLSAENGNPLLWALAVGGAFVTAYYSTRLVIVTFWGEMKTPVSEHPVPTMVFPLVILAFFSVAAGYIEWPHNVIHVTLFSGFAEKVLPATIMMQSPPPEILFQLLAGLAAFSGIGIGYQLYYKNPGTLERWKTNSSLEGIRSFLYKGWRFDDLYDFLFVKPYVWLAQAGKADVFDRIYNGIAAASRGFNRAASGTQNGSLRLYIAGVMFGILIILTLHLAL